MKKICTQIQKSVSVGRRSPGTAFQRAFGTEIGGGGKKEMVCREKSFCLWKCSSGSKACFARPIFVIKPFFCGSRLQRQFSPPAYNLCHLPILASGMGLRVKENKLYFQPFYSTLPAPTLKTLLTASPITSDAFNAYYHRTLVLATEL